MRIGAHVSTAGGVHTAVGRALEIGANCIQIFAGAPQRWSEPHFPEEDVARFRSLCQQEGIDPVFIHSAYLLNFASPDESLREKSIRSLGAALTWARALGAAGVITHLGSSKDGDPRQAEEWVCRSLSRVLDGAPVEPMLLLEGCAGQGNTVGRTFEQLGLILGRLGDRRAQVCLDTAHMFEAGYDIATQKGLERTIEEFDRAVGLSHLKVIHANDSKTPLGSNVDRHENIGHGTIGEEAFARILHHPALRPLPFILEVPGFANQGPDRPNIMALRRLAGMEDA